MENRSRAAELGSADAEREIQAIRAPGFVAGTQVWTREGRVPIETLRVGDQVLSKSENAREPSYRRVVRTFGFEHPWGVVAIDLWKSVEGWMAGERAGFVVTDFQPFHVGGAGWKAAMTIPSGGLLTLQDGSCCEVVNRSPLYHTPVEGVAWMDGFIDNQRGGGTGRTIDLRAGEVRFDYEMVPNPLAVDLYAPINRFRPPVFSIELEDEHGYFVGEWAVAAR